MVFYHNFKSYLLMSVDHHVHNESPKLVEFILHLTDTVVQASEKHAHQEQLRVLSLSHTLTCGLEETGILRVVDTSSATPAQ